MSYDIKQIKTVHIFNVTEKETDHKYVLKITESYFFSEPDIIIIDTETNTGVTNHVWEKVVEEFETKKFKIY